MFEKIRFVTDCYAPYVTCRVAAAIVDDVITILRSSALRARAVSENAASYAAVDIADVADTRTLMLRHALCR